MDDTIQPDAPLDPTPDDVMAQCVAIEREARLWLRGITAFVATRSAVSDPSDRVQFATDMAHIAALEAAARLMQRVRPADIV